MYRWLGSLPLFVQLGGLGIALLYLPMIHAIRLEDWPVARSLFYHATFLLIVLSLVAVASSGTKRGEAARDYLLTIFATFIVLPAALALPFAHLVPQAGFFGAYFEMLSSLTTTGATLFPDPAVLPAPLHLLRGLVGWFGGFFMLVVAMAIFAPLQIGGFEIFYAARGSQRTTTRIQTALASERLKRFSAMIFPIYALVTAALAIGLMAAGDRALVAVMHAMAVVSTSGISPVGGLSGTASGFWGEAVMLFFFFFAVTRHSFLGMDARKTFEAIKEDKELNLALACLVIIPGLLFLRHWTGAIEEAEAGDAQSALAALWGGLFTVASYLTTTGFESAAWDGATNWSGLGTPGLILMGLAVMGGGIATTAGGIKLLRVYALYKHGEREISRLVFPHSVAGQAARVRNIRREGAQVAWVVFMLFLIAVALGAMGFALTGMNFADSLVFAIAGLSTTGPLVESAGSGFTDYDSIPTAARALFCVAMVIGRLETLAVIALLNPDYWR